MFVFAVALGLASCAGGGFVSGSRQFSGVWLHEFEGSTFVEGATDVPAVRPEYRETDWLEWNEWPDLERLMDGAGHMDLWRSEVAVQRPISAKRLGPSFCYDR
ncbi:hypothetical protein E4M02_08575 [Brevundimonas sp. S30B]|uniref:hypothetical protein n=1 Tax=Brevundimonas sp. S30B TaxID=2561925 RepID=UPI001071C2BF|nr:hypothetical protein [Brevundimonas sp. S30B]QBX38411.1 hypothetical protein E4M01_12010 [Brevundimonas sp. MF30-B]TFW02120.1 hypothetical protein E4M02_08575 [Brevundimonas sp. S30B]